ncbi:acetyl esterase/lipase [Sphingosinicella soli]|uniref:Acetyl esterase/lipase n=2 Tax=Sphingosinicella soli TaxID=333708 RepID=A0A7W7F755_9SPHN|nr:prolyl oligopeptidase family serine peptidase [Sphingosinicella soli]MBB4632272.1 acetyl esterase/lipase [Sphingosinicella soli]
MIRGWFLAGLAALAASLLPHDARAASVEAPASLIVSGVPPVPAALLEQAKPYLEYRSARLLGWHPVRRSVLIGARDDSRQLYEVAAPGADPRQLTFGEEPVIGGEFSPVSGDVMLALADRQGDENYQIFRVEDGRMISLTGEEGRNLGVRWTRDGARIGYSTTRRTGLDTDLHIMDPRDPATDRLVMEGRGGGWSFADFSADGTRALLYNYISVTISRLFEIDLETRALRALVPPTAEPFAFGSARYGPGGRILAITDFGAEHRYLAEIDRATGLPRRLNAETDWSVEDFRIDPHGRFLAYVLNENGVSRLRLLDLPTGRPRAAPPLPGGIITGLSVAPWGEVGFSLATASSPGDVWSFDPDGPGLTRWTQSGAGLPAGVEPEIVAVKSFDGLPVSGLLYRPDPARFPGPRPLVMVFHGGPEGQSRPGFLGPANHSVNELGIALFFPNVRGSTGYGKTFVALDNGPLRREDAVRDVGAFLKRLRRDPGIDPSRMAVSGASYGGYMTLASLIRYPKDFRAGVSTVGISDFVTFLEGTGEYRRDLRRLEYGDERDPAERRKLKAISPLTRANRIRAPVLVVTGANDPRVPPAEADRIVTALRARGGTAWHVVAEDEGHGFEKKPNADYQFLVTVLFWQRYLLGTAPHALSSR